MPLISVILPTRDRSALLERAVRSVLAQSLGDLELIIVDNNRSEAPIAEASAAWLADPRVRVIRWEGVGCAAAARNAGLALCSGDWISYLDDDDAYRSTKLQRQLELCRGTQSPLVLCGAAFHLKERVRVVQTAKNEFRGDGLLLDARWNTPLLFHRRHNDLRFDESLSPGEDAELGHRILALEKRDCVPCVPEPLVDIYPQEGPRVNTAFAPQWRAVGRILTLRPGYFSRHARRCYVQRMRLAREKLAARFGGCLLEGWRLLLLSRGREWRSVANALLVSSGFLPGRWVS